MGIIITKFKKKSTTYEILEKLENEIHDIEEFRRSTEQTHKKMVGRFIFISVCVYCFTALIFYFYFFPATAYERIIYVIPLIVLPMLLLSIKRILTWYYNRKIKRNQTKLTKLKDDKKKILEEVMDKETYKVAKTILEKFAPEQVKRSASLNEFTLGRPATPASSSSIVPVQTGPRYRGQFSTSLNKSVSYGVTPRARPPTFPTKTPQTQIVPATGRPPVPVPGTPLLLPRAILPRDRSVLDKMVDYLVGDGPSNRYALICRNCSSHNGMALTEEFDYLSFRCCYCLTFNPARKQRPAAPRLEGTPSIKAKQSDASDSDPNTSSDTDSDSEVAGPIITEPSDSNDESRVLPDDKVVNLSDFDKLSDFEIKNSDTESSAMDVESSPNSENKSEIEATTED